MINLTLTSNVCIPGRWIFRVDSPEIQGGKYSERGKKKLGVTVDQVYFFILNKRRELVFTSYAVFLSSRFCVCIYVWSFIGWSFIRVVSHQGGHSSVVSLYLSVKQQMFPPIHGIPSIEEQQAHFGVDRNVLNWIQVLSRAVVVVVLVVLVVVRVFWWEGLWGVMDFRISHQNLYFGI